MTDGAYTLSRRLPNWLLTTGVTTTTWAPSGLVVAFRRISRFAAGTPRASSAEHISGSHATIALRATCCATHAAASWDAVLPAWPPAERAGVAGPWPSCHRARAAATPPAASRTTIAAPSPGRRHRRRPRRSRDGAGGWVTGAAG